ncbi:MAG TPA: gluconokinase, partial [Mycobacteriales bacterium]|nr:gluconokinase [Mycobacteriales bacterium]
QAERTGHFMPPSLEMSQFEALEPLGSDERGLAIDVGRSADDIVETMVAYLLARP